jgi:branched-chain amino acid transport system permease protein
VPPKSQLYLCAALLVAAVASAFSGRMDPYFLDVALGVGISIVLAASLNLINGFTGQFSLGHAGFMAVGAYTSAMVTTVLGPKLGASAAVQQWAVFPASLILGGLLAALAGLAVGAPSLRLKGDYLAIVTLGFGEIIRVILQNVEAVGGARGLVGVPSYTNLFWTFGGAAVTVYVVWGLLNSTYGRGFLAVADDEVAAEAMGLNTTRYKITAFAVGSFFAGVAGGLYAHLKGYLNPSGFDFNKSIEIVVMVILGGMGKHVGVIIAAILLTAIQEPLRKFGDYRMILYSVLLIVLMLTRPQGLFVVPPIPNKSQATSWANRCSLGTLILCWLGMILIKGSFGRLLQDHGLAVPTIWALGISGITWLATRGWVRTFGKPPTSSTSKA